MAPSSSLLQTWRYPVFAVFHREDVPRTFLSDLRVELSNNASTIMFEDQRMERSQPIAPGSVRESRRISIVVLTKNYASSSWCLDELVEILKCKKKMGHRVITVFYGVDPSDVRKQTGEFGIAFDETCARKTQEERQKWSQALTDVANIIGYHLGNWDNEANTIETIARDVSYTLNATTSRDNLVEPPSSNKPIRKSKSRHCCTGMAFLVVINLLLEIASAVADQLGTIRKPYFPRISLVVSILSVVLSILDLNYKIRAHKAGFRWKWRPIPWFHYPSGSHYRIFGSFTDTVLLFCVVGQLIVSTINCISIGRGQEGPIKVSVWPLFFAIGMVISNFMEKPANSEGTLPLTKMQ